MLVALQSDMFQSQPLCILGGIYVKMTRIFCYVFRSAPTHEMEFWLTIEEIEHSTEAEAHVYNALISILQETP